MRCTRRRVGGDGDGRGSKECEKRGGQGAGGVSGQGGRGEGRSSELMITRCRKAAQGQ